MQRVAHHYLTLVVAHTDLPPAEERQTILIGAKLAQVTVAFPVCACTHGLVMVCRAERFVKQLMFKPLGPIQIDLLFKSDPR